MYSISSILLFLYLLTIFSVVDLPLPTHRLASFALRALQVDAELSPFVLRSFSLLSSDEASSEPNSTTNTGVTTVKESDVEQKTILRTEYKAATNRLLRVAVNGFMESLGVVLGIMEELDIDILMEGA